ncbi:hypothetical protein COU36_02635, partial [Candidatus Micrarchaeota archaeon CG10_big_fil_rev_8_21_14_0_10_59_7]
MRIKSVLRGSRRFPLTQEEAAPFEKNLGKLQKIMRDFGNRLEDAEHKEAKEYLVGDVEEL